MTKSNNIFNLYNQLNKSGSRGDAIKYVANLCNVKVNTVKNHWFGSEELPDHVSDNTKDDIISYLQNTIKQQNQVAA